MTVLKIYIFFILNCYRLLIHPIQIWYTTATTIEKKIIIALAQLLS